MRGARGLGHLKPSLGVSSPAARLLPLYFFSGSQRGRGGKESELGFRRRMSGLEKRKTSPHLRWASSRGRPRESGEEVRAAPAAGWPGGPWASPAEAAGVGPGSRRGPAVPGSGGHRWRPGARRRMGSGEARPGGGPAGAGLLSRAPLLWEPREGGAKQLRKPCSRALEPFQAGPQRGGNGRAVGAAGWVARRRSLAAWGDVLFFRAPCIPADPDEHPTQVMRNPSRTQRRPLLPLDASIV